MTALFICLCGGYLIADRCAVAKDRYDRMVEQEACVEGQVDVEKGAA